MPRASSRSTDAVKGGIGLQEGIIKVVNAKFAVVQYSKKDGTLVTPFFGMVFDFVKCNDDLEPINEDDIMTKEFPISWASKGANGDFDFSKLKFHPGKSDGPDDEDPEDLGVEVGTEGNSMWAESSNVAPFADADWIIFTDSLEKKCGFKPEVNYQSYAPNYIGMIVEVHTIAKSQNPGAPARTSDRPQTCWAAKKVHVYPYDIKKGGKAGKSAGKSAGAAGAATPAAAGSNGSASPEAVEMFTRCINGDGTVKGVAERNSGKEFDIAKLHTAFMPVMTALKLPMPKQKSVLELVKKPEFWAGFAEENADAGIMLDADAGKVGFA